MSPFRGVSIPLVASEELAGDRAELVFQPICHRLFFAEVFFTCSLGLGVADLAGCGNEHFVAGDFHMFEWCS